MPTWELLRDLPLEIESYTLEGREQAFSPEFSRLTTTIHLAGGGEEGAGEDVVYDGLDHIAFQDTGRDLAARGLPHARLLLRAPGGDRPVSRIAPRARGLAQLPALGGGVRGARPRPRPGGPLAGGRARPHAGPAHLRGVHAPLVLRPRGSRERRQAHPAGRALPRHPLQARPHQLLDRGARGRAGRHGRRRLGRSEGPLQGHAGRRGHRPRALPDGGRGLPRRVDRGPRPLGSRGRRRARAPPRPHHLGRPHPLHRRTSRRCRSRPRW